MSRLRRISVDTADVCVWGRWREREGVTWRQYCLNCNSNDREFDVNPTRYVKQ